MRRLLIALSCSLLLGCAAKKPVGLNYIVPVACLQAPIRLRGCDANLLKCHQILVKMSKTCAELQANAEQAIPNPDRPPADHR